HSSRSVIAFSKNQWGNVLTSKYIIPAIPIQIFNRDNSTKSSTSAVEFKLTHPRKKAPPLPSFEPLTPSAEEAVTNILYNTPAPFPTPPKRHVLNCLVQNEPGVLSRVSGILAGRGFNIDSLVVARTEVSDLSRMTIVLRGHDVIIEQARRQLEDLVPVWAVLDYTQTSIVERELLLVKVSILGPEHLHGQLIAIKHDEYDDEFMPEADLESESPDATSVLQDDPIDKISPLTPSAALRQKHAHLRAIIDLCNLFKAHVIDVASDNVVVELTAKPTRLDAFIKLLKPFGILESARSGMMALPRTPLVDKRAAAIEEEEDVGVDATMLPPAMSSESSAVDNVDDSISQLQQSSQEQFSYYQTLQKVWFNAKQELGYIPNGSEGNFFKTAKWSPDGTCILTSSNDNILRYFGNNLNKLNMIVINIAEQDMEPAIYSHSGESVYECCWYPQMSSQDPSTCFFLVSSREHPIHLWDAYTGKLKCSFTIINHREQVIGPNSLTFNLDGS
ncbi:250_t:CDS:10, partial [Racocetra persica]